jgi:hypothetical protein
LHPERTPHFETPTDLQIESILAIRHDVIDKLLNIYYSRIDSFRLLDNINATACSDDSQQKKCDAIIYGSLVLGLQRIGLWPRKSADKIHSSINQLDMTLGSLQIFIIEGHQDCSPRHFKKEMAELTNPNEIPDPVLDSHRRHMEAQRTCSRRNQKNGRGKLVNM